MEYNAVWYTNHQRINLVYKLHIWHRQHYTGSFYKQKCFQLERKIFFLRACLLYPKAVIIWIAHIEVLRLNFCVIMRFVWKSRVRGTHFFKIHFNCDLFFFFHISNASKSLQILRLFTDKHNIYPHTFKTIFSYHVV